MNPAGKIPVLRHDGAHAAAPSSSFVLRESAAICNYLADLVPGSLAPPPGTPERATHDAWLFFIATELDSQGLYMHRKHVGLRQIYGEADAAVAAAQRYFRRNFIAATVGFRGPWLMGQQFTVADILMCVTHQQPSFGPSDRRPPAATLVASAAFSHAVLRARGAHGGHLSAPVGGHSVRARAFVHVTAPPCFAQVPLHPVGRAARVARTGRALAVQLLGEGAAAAGVRPASGPARRRDQRRREQVVRRGVAFSVSDVPACSPKHFDGVRKARNGDAAQHFIAVHTAQDADGGPGPAALPAPKLPCQALHASAVRCAMRIHADGSRTEYFTILLG